MVYLFLADGFEEMEAFGVLDVFRRAGVSLQTVGVTGKTVTSAHALMVTADIVLEEMPSSGWEMLFLPGGGAGVENLGRCEVLCVLLQKAFAEKIPVVAICAAPKLLSDLGLTEGRRVTCFPSFAEEIRSAGAEVQSEAPWIRDGQLVTGRGVGACLTFALAALSLIRDEETVRQTAHAVQTPEWQG